MAKGQINVKTENIFPIIKKFLYSDHEIFLRELISNAVDATTKLKALASMGDVTGELGDLTIEVKLDQKNKTLHIIDRGIGMTSTEVENYINQIAFSSAEEFLEKFKGKSEDETNAIIGHFGLGFYSSFMVSKKVEIITKSYKDEPAVKWECDGSPEYTMTANKKTVRGTEIILHIADDSLDFAEENKILTLLKKYCKFLPVAICFGEESTWEPIEGEKDKDGNDKTKEVKKPRIINNTNPAWRRKPADLTEEDYKSFYRELYPLTFEEPLFNIHLNVDYPFNLTGILYFPKVKKNFEVQREKIQLYSNQVFVTDSVEGIVPEFLTLMHGVIDSPDIPLNVSRSYLQSDSNVKKISNHIMKKVADKLEEIFKNNREEFQQKWDDIRIFIEYGMVSDEKFYERALKFVLLKDTDGKYYTLDEYKELVKDNQTDKNKKLVYLYTTNVEDQNSYVQTATEHGYNVLIMDGVLDQHFMNTMEQKLDQTSFARVDAEIIDKLIEKEDALPSLLSDDDKKKLQPVIEQHVDKVRFHVMFESLSASDLPVLITQNEFMRRMRDMSAMGGGGGFGFGNMPESYSLVINANHPLVTRMAAETDAEKQSLMAKQLTDLALLSQNLLKGQDLTAFIKRSVDLI
jgi:molecular chaperone HtpG